MFLHFISATPGGYWYCLEGEAEIMHGSPGQVVHKWQRWGSGPGGQILESQFVICRLDFNLILVHVYLNSLVGGCRS